MSMATLVGSRERRGDQDASYDFLERIEFLTVNKRHCDTSTGSLRV